MYRVSVSIAVILFLKCCGGFAQPANESFETLQQASVKLLFEDPGTGDWTEGWFKDGERSIVQNTPRGMVFSAGPVFGDNGSHSVIWTKQDFKGNIKIEFDYTRLDDIDRAVNILYIQATGTGTGPYHTDITQWSHLRQIPYMRTYFQNMNLLHISYAAFPTDEGEHTDYVRARVYPVPKGGKFSTDTRLLPDNFDTGMFVPGVTYHFTVIKHRKQLLFEVKELNGDRSKLFTWDLSNFQQISHGRIGIRHMYTRSARYANFKVYQLEE